MSYNGSGTFTINSTGQPVVAGTVITASAFNALTTDLATGLTTAITKDGQTTTTAQIPFAQGLRSTLVTDSSSVSTGSIITDGGVGIAKNLNVGGTLNVTGATTLTNPVINNIKMGYTTTATAGGSTSLTVSSNYRQFFTGTLAQTIVLPVTSTLVTGMAYEIENNSTGTLTVNSSGGNLVGTIPAGVCAHAVCIGTTLTTAADWDWDYISTSTITGTGANVLGTSPTITTATLASPNITTALTIASAAGTAGQVLTSGGSGSAPTWTTASASQWTTSGSNIYYSTGNVSVGTSSNTANLDVRGTNQATVDGYIGGNLNISTTNTATADYGGMLTFGANYTGTSYAGLASIAGRLSATGSSTGYMIFSTTVGGTGSVERMRITSDGSFVVGRTSVPTFTDTTGVGFAYDKTYTTTFFVQNQPTAVACTYFNATSYTSGTAYFCQFRVNGVTKGNITSDGSTTTYATTSDYRLKEDVQPMTGALAKVSQLKPVTYKWKESGANGQGFIAHELQAVVPDCVSGEKDAVDKDGNPVYQGIDTSFLVATLTAAIQELKTINDTQAETINALTATLVALTARVTALENA